LVNNGRKEVVYNRNERIKAEGDEINSFLYLRKGLVKLFKTDNTGKDHILSINKPGDFISLLHIFSNETYRYNIVALEETLVCEVDLQIINYLIKSNRDFALTVINRMGKIADEIIDAQFDQSQKQIKGRIATLLLFFADQIYQSKKFQLPITRREIGELISMTSENAIRTLSAFNQDGIIAIEGKEVEIVNYELLQKIAKNG